MRQLAVVAALLAVGGTGACALLDFSTTWADRADRTPCGMLVEWGSRKPDQAGLCSAAAACQFPSGAEKARVVFTTNMPAGCLPMIGAGACFASIFDFIYLPPAETGWPGLCHELHHRALWLQGRDLDYAHAGPGWTE